jgi:hypothetical protein
MEMSIDVEELQMFDGIASCANHTINFKIGKCSLHLLHDCRILTLFLVENELDLLANNQSFFNPKFTHQIFHKDETIKGMKDLSVTIFLSPTTLKPYLYWCCSDYGQQYDDVTNILKINFGPESLITNREEFTKVLK